MNTAPRPRRHSSAASLIPMATLAALLLASACNDSVGPVRTRLAITAGDGQRAPAGTELPDPVVVELRDAAGRPISGVRVGWSVEGGAADVIAPATNVTDAQGKASASWRIDATPGTHTILATADGGATARVSAIADPASASHVHPLPIVTYDGSGQAVHPDFVRLPQSWSGGQFRLVATPYPGGDASFENPSLYAGNTGDMWRVPERVHNPLELPQGGSYLSDPDIVFDPDLAELRIYYRRVTTENEIWMIRSADGVVWSAPVLIVHAANHMIVSPTIVRRSSTVWLMWSVNSGAIGCGASTTAVELRRSSDGITWRAPETATLSDRDGFPWHIDVEWIASRNEYWAVYPVKRPGGCTTDRLRFATSPDGMQWKSYPSPLLMKGAIDQMRDVVYRSTIDFDAASGIVSIWYSGAKNDHGPYNWHLAWERLSIDALFARVNAPTTVAARVATRESAPLAELTNATAP